MFFDARGIRILTLQLIGGQVVDHQYLGLRGWSLDAVTDDPAKSRLKLSIRL